AARNPRVLAACARFFAKRGDLTVCDIGAGTGAAVRAFAEFLPERQTWILIDRDRQNLATASRLLRKWAHEADRTPGGLVLRRGRREIDVRTRLCDLAAEKLIWPKGTGLVTASALFDLTSVRWITRFANSLKAHGLPLLATLTFN